ncbi:hypothetical protein A2246_03135 [candidate division WOR-1 bacterium RIFOXYA2_FULL_37_7]|uniref:NADH:ubiquinone oxidoreductase intermediate-associated protein 30 domain-containing protein n=1 Tax=candidate division WOR-1 bacterium RIFOXYB2_FULL_37_13 TaxID=1802579 RepID=A0A1F4SVG2_UNCSA|nr:MAG: hypothetical protein A2246_03135 [candidate division WOR-1 bacterium RIFOXYA2_FULL_37_7]OGC24428.1 MAG: hypothetical protein A2310_08475 [candidate division WOR-1 bacterium RIFOXYB2_FULL_37_13]
MKKLVLFILIIFVAASAAYARLTFYLVDNFEDGILSNRWYVFDKISASVVPNPESKEEDSVAEACGDKVLKLEGKTSGWYVGGMGTILGIDGADYSRMVIDIYGSKSFGKIKLELFEKNGQEGTNENEKETKWVVEIPVLGKGFTRYSVPLSAFYNEDTKDSDVVFHGTNGGNISKLQVIFVSATKEGVFDCAVDNIMFTF